MAWTPFDDPLTERLLSFQLSLSHERYFADRVAGVPDQNTGGWGTLLHPGIVWGPGNRILVMGTTSFPAAQDYREPAAEDRWRIGFGIVWLITAKR